MSDRAALYAAVCADPDDDTARLVYADWLEEYGGTAGARRAAFVRAKVAHHRLRTADTPAAWVYRFLEADSPVDVDRIDWSKVDADLGGLYAAERAVRRPRVTVTPKSDGIPKLGGILFEGDERGFLSSATVDGGPEFLRHAEAVFRAAPVTEVTFRDLDEDSAREIVARGLLGRIRSLSIWEMEDARPLEILGRSQDAAAVRELDLDGMEAEPTDIADALIRGKNWTGLRKLSLMDFGDGDGAMAEAQAVRLFRKPVFSGLRELVAWGNNLGDDAARAVGAGGMPELRFLDLAINSITGDGAAALARSKGLPNLRYLDLASNNVADGAAVAAVLNSAQFPGLVVLRLGGNVMAAADPKVLARPGRGPTLRVLELPESAPTAESVAALAACPAVHGLWCLIANSAHLTAGMFLPLLASPGFDRLTLLDLQNNRLTVRAARALAGWPKASALQWLGLGGNPLTPDGLAALADSSHLGGLKHLSVSGPGTSGGMRRLKKRFGKRLTRTA